MAELAELLLQADTTNMPGSLKEEIRQFIKFAQEKVVKHQAFKAINSNIRGQKCRNLRISIYLLCMFPRCLNNCSAVRPGRGRVGHGGRAQGGRILTARCTSQCTQSGIPTVLAESVRLSVNRALAGAGAGRRAEHRAGGPHPPAAGGHRRQPGAGLHRVC